MSDMEKRNIGEIELPIKDRNKFNEVVKLLREYYFFRSLPTDFTNFDHLPRPRFLDVGELVFE